MPVVLAVLRLQRLAMITREAQTQSALDGIHTLATLVPGVIYIVVFLILVFLYPLSKKRTNQLAADLAEKRKI